jgi:hypothetical protein
MHGERGYRGIPDRNGTECRGANTDSVVFTANETRIIVFFKLGLEETYI